MPELMREFGAAGATLVVMTGLFAWLLRTVMAGWQGQIARFTTLLENHLVHNTAALVDLAAAVRELSEEMRRSR